MSSAALETIGYRAPLALRCVDTATGAEVAAGLQATAWRPGDSSDVRTAVASAVSALLGFGTLPGLRSLEYSAAAGDGPVTFPAGTPVTFIVAVADTGGAYLPQVFEVTVPQTVPVTVPLYSAPARSCPAGCATVYGQAHTSSGAPAAWALVDVRQGAGAVATAVCDQRGCFVLYLPYPEALPALSGHPPHGTGIANVTWQLTVSVRCSPESLAWPANPAPAGPPDRNTIEAQTAAQVVQGGSQHASITATLTYGIPLLLRLEVVPS